MVDTLVKLIINIEEGWGNHFVYDVILGQGRLRKYDKKE